MQQLSFLDGLSQWIVDTYGDRMEQLTVLVPSKRARIFLMDALRNKVTKTSFAPQIISIEQFTETLSGLKGLDPVALLFEFYQAYTEVTPEAERERFEVFAQWAQTALQDFNEMDRYLVPPETLFRHLFDIKEIEHWSTDPDQKTELIEQYLAFWKKLPGYYHTLNERLLAKKRGYQGMLYRKAAQRADSYFITNPNMHWVFAGFNALNQAEEVLFQSALSTGRAHVFWDIDPCFLADQIHDAGMFIRKYKAHWPHYKTHEMQGVSPVFQQPKKIFCHGTPKSLSQALKVSQLISEAVAQGQHLANTAVILGDETLLGPLLQTLPAEAGPTNVTMGLPVRSHPVQQLLKLWLHMHIQAFKRGGSYTFYHKEVLEILEHSSLSGALQSGTAVDWIRRQNLSFVSHKRLMEQLGAASELAVLLFDPIDRSSTSISRRMLALLDFLKELTPTDTQPQRVFRAYLFAIYKTVGQLHGYVETYLPEADPEWVYALYKQLMELSEVSLEGEPLEGLQVMGVLESRVLDFSTVIITSVNEGVLPSGAIVPSFIPYDLKQFYGLPTVKEKDAIYAYHFYHALQRAQTVHLIYNAEKEGLDAGEKSRFIRQLELEPRQGHELVLSQSFPPIPALTIDPIHIAKTPQVMARLHEMAQRGLSPTAIADYLRNPVSFYFKWVLGIRPEEEVEESIAANTLGTIIHGVLEDVLKPFLGKQLAVSDIDHCLTQISQLTLFHFEHTFREGDFQKGRNLLSFEIAQQTIKNFLEREKKALTEGTSIELLALETKLTGSIIVANMPQRVQLKGTVDRIELRNGCLQITDYKTGKVMANQLKLADWSVLREAPSADKIIQVMMYALMYHQESDLASLKTCIFSFKNMKDGFMPFMFDKQDIVDAQRIAEFEVFLSELLFEIFDGNVPFTEPVEVE
ncbi:MAG: hypothetical protein CFE24_04075 [Flavobacterium sp. BFFFF2]|nr:MAG: hypothetical protein CFE24_04075 [Flavobacterium sp. BFFFF2]